VVWGRGYTIGFCRWVGNRDGNRDFPVAEWFLIPVLANAHGEAFSPIPIPVGEFIPVGNPAGNLSLLEVQYLKINLN
jgi:hypothetical protein